METHAKLGNALMHSLVTLRGSDGSFNMADVGALFERLSASLHPTDAAVKERVELLARSIAQARQELSAIGGGEAGATGDASQQLDAVIKTTEEASVTFMDAADGIRAIAEGLTGDAKATLENMATKIYEACNFQDLTGQRVRKVIRLLAEIDAGIHTILRLFGKGGQAAPKRERSEDEKLLNGPQLPDTAPSQDDIDALFNASRT